MPAAWMRMHVVEWTDPGLAQQHFGLDQYADQLLVDCIESVIQRTGAPHVGWDRPYPPTGPAELRRGNRRAANGRPGNDEGAGSQVDVHRPAYGELASHRDLRQHGRAHAPWRPVCDRSRVALTP